MLERAPFTTGDIVRLRNGKSAIKVLEVNYFDCSTPEQTPRLGKPRRNARPGWYIRFMYVSAMRYEYNNSMEHRSWRMAWDFVHYDQRREDMNMKEKLYQTKEEKPRFGMFLTRTSTNKIALEMKGSGGEVETFEASEVEEVMPHTVCLQRFQGGDNKGESRHYEIKPGAVEVNDVLVHLSSGALFKVVAVDTKSKTARVSRNGFFKLQGSFIQVDN